MDTIFLIEDDPLMTRMYERTLRLNGFNFDISPNGKEALEKIDAMERKPALILLDIMMPEIDGFETLRRIKSDPLLRDIPIIALSNLSAGLDTGEKILRMGADMFLIKSQHSPQDVVKNIRVILEKNNTTRADIRP